ncbi:MAG: hypothetical protein ABJP33_20730 [Pseudoruegeria sp.]
MLADLSKLSAYDLDVVKKCIEASLDKRIIPEMEFSILMGVSHEEAKAIVEAWPALNSDDEITQMTIQGSMNNLIGYPHGKFDLIQHDYDIDTAQISEVYLKVTSSKSTPSSS